MSHAEGNCSNAMSQPQTLMVCCCSMGAAWGNACQACPEQGSRTYFYFVPQSEVVRMCNVTKLKIIESS